MYKISCTSEHFKNADEYSSYQTKKSVKLILQIFSILECIFLLVVLQTNRWSAFFKITLGISFLVILVYLFRRYFADPKLFNRELKFDSHRIYVKSLGKERSIEFEKLFTVNLYKNLVLLEWFDKKFPWLVSVQVDGLDDLERSPDVSVLIALLKSKSIINDKSKFRI
jgi:hypothetical protein